MNFSKPKHVLPKIEDLEVNTEYAITLNPARASGTRQLNVLVNLLIQDIKAMVDSMTLKLYPEYSPVGRLHYHGTVQIHDIIQYVKDITVLIEHFTVCIKPLAEGDDDDESEASEEDDEQYATWEEYCRKQEEIIKPVLEAGKLAYPVVINTGNDIPANKKKVIKVRKLEPETLQEKTVIDLLG